MSARRAERKASPLFEITRLLVRFDHDLHFVRHQLWQLSATLAEEAENKTQLKWRQRFSSREHFEQVRSFVAEANEQVLDRLEAELARM